VGVGCFALAIRLAHPSADIQAKVAITTGAVIAIAAANSCAGGVRPV